VRRRRIIPLMTQPPHPRTSQQMATRPNIGSGDECDLPSAPSILVIVARPCKTCGCRSTSGTSKPASAILAKPDALTIQNVRADKVRLVGTCERSAG